MSKKKQNVLAVEVAPGQTIEKLTADATVNPALNAAFVVDTYRANILSNEVEMVSLVEALRASMDKSAAGDLSGLEAMLIGQATALQTIFVSLAKRAHHQQYQRHLEAFLGLALKAQAQSRATIQAVIDLKFPRQATFVKQANIAHGPQQVNNGQAIGGDNVRALENQTGQNEVLEGLEHGGKEMDTGATAEAARRNPEVEAMAASHRAKKRGR